MAENESLDLTSRHARRWNMVRDAAQKGGSCQEVASLTKKMFFKALRKTLREFVGYEVTTADFFASRGSPAVMRALVRQTKNHDYAELLATVIDSYPGAPPSECLDRWGHAILDKVFDQMALGLGGSQFFPSFFDTKSFFREVRNELQDDLTKVAVKLADDPHWKPIVRTKKGEPKNDPTASQLSVSLIGGPKP
jgi:hypothetical protein